MVSKTLMSLAEFERLPDDGMRHELNEGELVTMTHPKSRHTRTAQKIDHELARSIEGRGLGEVYTEMGYLLSEDPPSLRVSDVSFLSAAKVAELPEDGWPASAPELAVEVVSASDSAEDLTQKVRQYLAAGARVVWVVYPRPARSTFSGPMEAAACWRGIRSWKRPNSSRAGLCQCPNSSNSAARGASR